MLQFESLRNRKNAAERDVYSFPAWFLTLAGGALAFAALPAGLAGAAADVDPTDLFNQIRKANGLSSMATDSKLEQAALYQARRMASYGKIGHSVGWGNGFVSRLKQAGIRGPAAENVAAGQPNTQTVFDAWMKSPGHRKTCLIRLFSITVSPGQHLKIIRVAFTGR